MGGNKGQATLDESGLNYMLILYWSLIDKSLNNSLKFLNFVPGITCFPSTDLSVDGCLRQFYLIIVAGSPIRVLPG
jgi:hypothetical protein